MSDLKRFNEKKPFSYRDIPNRRPRYNDDSDYTTNAPSYYDDLARKTALMKRLSLRVWEYQELINKQFDEWDEELRKRFLAWDKNLEEFDDEVLKLLQQWLLDGTLDHIINETIFSWKVDQDDFDELEKEVERIDEVKAEKTELERVELESKQEFENVRQEREQKDFTDIISEYTFYPNIQIQKINDGNGFQITLSGDDGKQITHQFVYNGASSDGRDGYLIHTRTWEGGYQKSFKNYRIFPITDLSTNGNFIPPTDVGVSYTTTIGDTFTQDLIVEEGDGISLVFFANRSGGLWKLELVGEDDIEPVEVSTYTQTGNRNLYTPFKFLPAGEYTLKGTFMGDDPRNPPQNGEGTSRGFLASIDNSVVRLSKEFVIPELEDDNLIKTPSNIEFAYNIKENENDDYQFVPFHGDRTSIEQYPMKLYDGNQIINFDEMPNLGYKHVEHFLRIEQKIFGTHPNSSRNLIEIMTYHTLTKNGMIKLDGKMKVLRPTYFTNSYVIMGVARAEYFNRILSSYDNIYNNTSDEWLASNSVNYLENEDDNVKSFMFLDTRNKSRAIAFSFNDIKQTLRQYEPDKDSKGNKTYIQHRNERLVKIYSRLWKAGDNLMPTGYTHTFSGKWAFNNQLNIYDILSIK